MVLFEFILPEVAPSCRNAAFLAVVGMPEAAIDEDDHPVPREDYVWLAGKASIMEFVTEPMGMQIAADQ
jgi:hypothetical protein